MGCFARELDGAGCVPQAIFVRRRGNIYRDG
jgi:hypothetical protein